MFKGVLKERKDNQPKVNSEYFSNSCFTDETTFGVLIQMYILKFKLSEINKSKWFYRDSIEVSYVI